MPSTARFRTDYRIPKLYSISRFSIGILIRQPYHELYVICYGFYYDWLTTAQQSGHII